MSRELGIERPAPLKTTAEAQPAFSEAEVSGPFALRPRRSTATAALTKQRFPMRTKATPQRFAQTFF